MLPPHLNQRIGHPVLVDNWEPDQEFPYLPLGQKPKRVLICPTNPPHSYLVGGHRYLFKEPTGYAAQQVWSEVIAYRIACEIGVDVPPAFVGFDSRTGSTGVLIEYFYGYRERPETRFVHARDFFQAARVNFNPNLGSLHDNILLTRLMSVQAGLFWWAETIGFDTLIGNTDRHSENWGFLLDPSNTLRPQYRMAPAFDNGSSLGHVVRDQDLRRGDMKARVEAFIKKGTHHTGWTSIDPKSAKHINLCPTFLRHHDRVASSLARMAALSDSEIERCVLSCAGYGLPLTFIAPRATFIYEQIKARRAIIRQSLGG